MIVKEQNWDTPLKNTLKTVIVTDLFDKIGKEIAKKSRNNEEIDNKFFNTIQERVDNYFFTLVGGTSEVTNLLPTSLKYANRFYVFTVKVIPTGGVLITFVAQLGGDVDPVLLHLIY